MFGNLAIWVTNCVASTVPTSFECAADFAWSVLAGVAYRPPRCFELYKAASGSAAFSDLRLNIRDAVNLELGAPVEPVLVDPDAATPSVCSDVCDSREPLFTAATEFGRDRVSCREAGIEGRTAVAPAGVDEDKTGKLTAGDASAFWAIGSDSTGARIGEVEICVAAISVDLAGDSAASLEGEEGAFEGLRPTNWVAGKLPST